jgi:hypothetical protein
MLLRDILHPVNLPTFLYKAVRGRKLMHIKSCNSDLYKDLMNDAIIDCFLTKIENRRFDPLRQKLYTIDELVDYVDTNSDNRAPQSCKTKKGFNKRRKAGYTVLVKDIGRFSDEGRELHNLLRDLDNIFQTNYNLWCNLYISNKKSALKPHVDQHSVIVLQYSGKKIWDFFGQIQDWKTNEPVNQIELNQGDFLYFPKWAPHVAHPIPGVKTAHATIELPSSYDAHAKYPLKWLKSREPV